MTITELLEAHKYNGYEDVSGEYWDWEIGCKGCEWTSKNCGDANEEAHRAHVAQVLGQHMQEREARAWSAGFHKGRKTPDGSHISTWPKNPYRKESSDGC